MSESSLGHVPAKEKWEFDEGVTSCFEDMLRRSIPQYDVMRETVSEIAGAFMRSIPGGAVLDLGSSRGDAIASLVEGEDGRSFYAVESSPPMLEVLRGRFALRQNVRVVEGDLRRFERVPGCAVALSVLTLQFVPINYRQAIVREVYESLEPGGALVLVEKVLGSTAEIDELMVSKYHALKGANGYSPDEIARKQMSLEGVLVPVTRRWNEDLLRQAGFRHVDVVWTWMNFSAWVAIRD